MKYLELFENWLPKQTKEMLIKKLAQYIDAAFDVSGLSYWVADPNMIHYKDVFNPGSHTGQDFFEIIINDNNKFLVKSGYLQPKEKEFELEDHEGIVEFIAKTNKSGRLKLRDEIRFNYPYSRLNRWKKFNPESAKKKYGYQHW